ncbi:MAG: DUF374 domain-containing protein [Rhizobiales bacterium]|nr:DUF374 domain-containing protein [Hyphomicrobiales bacterium]
MTTVGPALAAPAKRARWHHHPLVRRCLASLIAGYIRLIDHTGRWELVVAPAAAALIRDGRPFIVAFWHGRLLMMYPAWRRLLAEIGRQPGRRPPNPQAHVISSAHGDGQLIQLAVHRFGLKTLWGSSKRGGAKVLRAAIRVLEAGDVVVVTLMARAVRAARPAGDRLSRRQHGRPVVPITFASRHQRTFRSWDRFMLVRPFARGTLAVGEPVMAVEGDDTESRRLNNPLGRENSREIPAKIRPAVPSCRAVPPAAPGSC